MECQLLTNYNFWYLQSASLHVLERENEEAAKKLESVVQQGEHLLAQIQEALHDIAQSQLEKQALQRTDDT